MSNQDSGSHCLDFEISGRVVSANCKVESDKKSSQEDQFGV